MRGRASRGCESHVVELRVSCRARSRGFTRQASRARPCRNASSFPDVGQMSCVPTCPFEDGPIAIPLDKVAFKERCGSSKALTITLIAAGAAIAVVLWLAFSIHNWGAYTVETTVRVNTSERYCHPRQTSGGYDRVACCLGRGSSGRCIVRGGL